MSTFFDKLTGVQVSPQSSDVPEAGVGLAKDTLRKPAKRVPPKREDGGATHLKVESEETEAPARPDIPEDEGELTVDIYDRGDDIVIQSTVAGVKPEDLDVSITNDMVTVKGSRRCQEEIAEENYYYKELFWGTFSRSVILPEEINEDEAEAALKNGLLTIVLPKKKKGVVQKLKVKVT